MSTVPNLSDLDISRIRHLIPGRDAGRTVDGVDLVIDGRPGERMEPRWVRQLKLGGYSENVDGAITFTVRDVRRERWETFDNIRSALRSALAGVAAGAHPDDLRIEARTSTGQRVEVVTGVPILGMAIGALEDEPIRLIEGPSMLPTDA